MVRKYLRIMIAVLFCFSCSAKAAVRIGTPVYDPPFVANTPGYAIGGFDIQLMNIICARLHWQCEYIGMGDYQLFPALQANKIDFYWGQSLLHQISNQSIY
ncbi:transporter substrate-binding domain-containing protein [Legionella tunisiensis]|uniref:transporter substrate-binding domain-containing protein n=1 Tax=Legionella tunisiensis TaxID=1034944 RepID=UPI0009FCAD95